MTGYVSNIEEITLQNNYFRQVLYTGKYAQLVVMSLLPGEEIGMEVHQTVDQFFRFEKGQGKVIIDGIESLVQDGSAVIVPAGAQHNIMNVSQTEPLKLYTIYTPPNHPDGTIHQTKAEAMAAEAVHEQAMAQTSTTTPIGEAIQTPVQPEQPPIAQSQEPQI